MPGTDSTNITTDEGNITSASASDEAVIIHVVDDSDILIVGIEGDSGAEHIDADEFMPYGQYDDYEELHNKLSIEGTELVGDRRLYEFGMGTADIYDIRRLFS